MVVTNSIFSLKNRYKWHLYSIFWRSKFVSINFFLYVAINVARSCSFTNFFFTESSSFPLLFPLSDSFDKVPWYTPQCFRNNKKAKRVISNPTFDIQMSFSWYFSFGIGAEQWHQYSNTYNASNKMQNKLMTTVPYVTSQLSQPKIIDSIFTTMACLLTDATTTAFIWKSLMNIFTKVWWWEHSSSIGFQKIYF